MNVGAVVLTAPFFLQKCCFQTALCGFFIKRKENKIWILTLLYSGK